MAIYGDLGYHLKFESLMKTLRKLDLPTGVWCDECKKFHDADHNRVSAFIARYKNV